MTTKTEAPVRLGLHVAAPALTADEAVDEELLELDEEEEDDEDDEVEVELDPTVDEVELVDVIVPLVTPEVVELEELPAATARSVSKRRQSRVKKRKGSRTIRLGRRGCLGGRCVVGRPAEHDGVV